MTDNDIIKALECCGEANNCSQCEYKPTKYHRGTVGCTNELMTNALDLINRQKAEIERLKKSRDKWRQIAEDFDRATREAEQAGET